MGMRDAPVWGKMAATVIHRRSRLRGRHENSEENVTLDYQKDPSQNLLEVLQNVIRQEGISKAKKLGYFNAFVRLIYRFGSTCQSNLTKEQILCCLRVGLLHEAKEMRTACLRALRYFINDVDSLNAFVRLHMDYLVAKSLDICLDNEYERIHAMRLIRKVIQIAPLKFPRSLLTVMVSIVNDGNHENDKMVKACLATICELALSNPAAVAECGGVGAILRNVLDCYNFPRVNESLLATVLYLLNHPSTRQYVRPDVDLELLLAPFTDSHFRLKTSSSSEHRNGEEKENVCIASKMAIVTVIRSWPGMIRLCKPDGSGLQSLLGAFCLPNMETRKEIMDILFELFRLPVPLWTVNVSMALLSIDPSAPRESWRLVEGFVAEEGKCILPHLTRTRPNLVDNHMALILYAFINAQLLEALIEVITTSEDNLSIRATMLLGELLHLANTIIPHKISLHSHCLPTLVTLATSPSIVPEDLERAKRAQMAVTCLTRHHAMKKRGPVPSSLFLDQITTRAAAASEESNRPQRVNRDKLLQCLDKRVPLDLLGSNNNNDVACSKFLCIPLHCMPTSSYQLSRYESHSMILGSSVHESQVLVTKNNSQWDWDLVVAILKWPDETLRNFNDQSVQKFVRRLLHFFKPTNRLYGAMEHNHQLAQKCTVAALHFVDFLLECDEGGDATKAVEELLHDIGSCLQEIRTHRAPHEALFQPSVLIHTLSHYYFLLLGRFSASVRGDKYLQSTGVFQLLLDLVTITSHDTYVKLVVSSLDFSRDGLARIILSKALTATSEASRLYSTSFLRVLLRARVPFLGNWSMEMLVMQLYDQAKPVAMEALSVISEACEEEVNLHTLIKMRPSVLHLGYKGAMLLARFLSIPAGYKFLHDANYITHELEKWHKTFNAKYVQIVEERLNEAQTTYEKTYDGSYTRRSARRQQRKDVLVPVHLYGQLVQHKEGFTLLEQQPYLHDFFQCVATQSCDNKEEVLRLKTALWALGHMGTSIWGLNLLQDENAIPDIIKVAEESPVFSLRGTAFYVLGLLASTKKGADILREFGWESVRHTRTDLWPVIEEVNGEGEVDILSSVSSLSLSGQSEGPRGSSTVLPTLHHSDGPTDHSTSPGTLSGSSPKATFYLEQQGQSWGKPRSGTTDSGAGADIQTRSRSNTADSTDESKSQTHSDTGSTPATVGSSRDSSPKVSFEGLYEDQTDGAVHGREQLSSKSGRSESEPIYRLSKPANGGLTTPLHLRSNSDPPPVCEEKDRLPSLPQNLKDQNRIADKLRTNTTDLLIPEVLSTPDSRQQRAIASYQDERSGSNESSRTSKSHTDTDTPTSGISSYDSGPPGASENPPLTPIPSASSMATGGSPNSSLFSAEAARPGAHPSDSIRRAANLRRVPVQRRYSNPGLGPLSPLKSLGGKRPLSESMIVYATPDDSQGYAALRQLQRARTLSHETEAEISCGSLIDDTHVPKTRSLDFRIGKQSSSSKNRSHQSLPDLDLNIPGNPYQSLTRSVSPDFLRNSGTSVGRAEYIGLCLPVDVNMIFQVVDSSVTNNHKSSGQNLPPTAPSSLPTKLCLQRSVSDCGEMDMGLEHHSIQSCLGCYRITRDNTITIKIGHVDEEGTEETYVSSDVNNQGSLMLRPTFSSGASPGISRGLAKSRNSSMSDMAGQASVASTMSYESGSKAFMSEDSEVGRVLIRKEALRFIINLSSSISIKSSEQGLLSLKQKFSKAFQDVCLYSEACYLLANYNFRIHTRRFIQELFQDTSFDELYREPMSILNITQEAGSPPDVRAGSEPPQLEQVPESAT